MRTGRREFLQTLAATGVCAAGRLTGAETVQGTRLGIGNSSYGIHARVKRDQGFSDPLQFLEFCRARGAGGVQLPIGVRDEDYATRFRERAEVLGMFVEGSVSTPQDETGAARFEQEVLTARRAGAVVLRTVMLGGRRYETFRTMAEFRTFREQYWRRLSIVEPIVARHGLQLAVENHKDLRADEQAEMLRRLSSAHVGACIDTGNNLALLETPVETVATLSPWAVSCHLKDMAVERSADGFLLSEVPLGQGMLDLQQIVKTLQSRRPEVRFSLEMITRDPLRIPHLAQSYWETLFEVPMTGTRPALEYLRERYSTSRLPRITQLADTGQLAREDGNVLVSLQYAREKLGL